MMNYKNQDLAMIVPKDQKRATTKRPESKEKLSSTPRDMREIAMSTRPSELPAIPNSQTANYDLENAYSSQVAVS